MRTFLLAALFFFASAGFVRADEAVVVFVESSDSDVTSERVRARMQASGVGAVGPADAPSGPVASMAIVFRGAGQEARFRLRTLDGRIVVRDAEAPASNSLVWVVRRANGLLRTSRRAARNESSNDTLRPVTEVLDPWSNDTRNPRNRSAQVVVNPWDHAEEPRRRRRRRSVGRVAGASVARYSEVLDPWSQAGRSRGDIVDPWNAAEGGDGLARPRRGRRR